MTYIELFILNILIIYGVNFAAYNVFSPVTAKVFDYMANYSKVWVLKPVYACKPCMSSLWGLAGFIPSGLEWYYYPVWVLALCGAIVILNFKA